MSLPRISIITPSFNQGQFLEQTIRSVLDQGYPNLEYFVIDGGSSDDSVAIIERYADRLSGWVSEKDHGQSDAVNKGFARATGDVFGFINSDDVLYPGSLDRVGKAIAQGAQWITGWVKFVDSEGDEWPQTVQAVNHAADWFVTNPIPQQGSFWAGKFWKELGPFREEYRYVFDYDYWMRLRFRAGVMPTVVPKCMGSYRMHASSKTVSEFDRFEPEFARVRSEYIQLLSRRERRQVARRRRQFEAEQHAKKAWQALSQSQLSLARKHARANFRRAMTTPDAWRLMCCALRGH